MATRRVPDWNLLWNMYYDYYYYPDSYQVKQLLGGRVATGNINNTCAVRMSAALNCSGVPIPRYHNNLTTIQDGNGNNIAIRTSELNRWLRYRFGETDFYLRKQSGEPFDKSQLAGKKGIISFRIKFSDASGHIDLWDGSKFSSEYRLKKDYWTLAYRIYFWECGK